MKGRLLLYISLFATDHVFSQCCGGMFSSRVKTVKVSCAPSDAQIYVDGRILGMGAFDVKIAKNSCSNIRAEKTGFVAQEVEYCYKPPIKPPKNLFFDLKEDEAFISSVQVDYANRNFQITLKSKMTENEAWKLFKHIIYPYFESFEIDDKEGGFLKTPWEVQRFSNSTIRTRLILKIGSTNPLTYKVKLESEHSKNPNASAKEDESYKQWGRILKKYEGLIPEIQTRAENK